MGVAPDGLVEIRIGAGAQGARDRLRELWRFRELALFLAWRDIQVRYRQTAIGVLWAVLQPVMMAGLFSVVFGRLAQVPSDGVPYPLFAFAGLLPWTFVTTAITESGNSLVSNPDLITRVYLPRVLVPGAAVLAAVLDLVIASGVLVALLLWYGVTPTVGFFWLPLLVLLSILLSLAIGTGLAALNVRYRDVRYAIPFLLQLWLFATPVIYPTSMIPDRWRPLLALNPMSGIIEGFRAALFGTAVDTMALADSALVIAIALPVALAYFARVARTFADVV